LYLDDLEVIKARPPDFPPPMHESAATGVDDFVATAVDESTKHLEDQCG
jgi:hypothetical protein